MSVADPNTWYLVKCTDCGKPLKVLGQPPKTPLCLHCDIIRFAPDAIRDSIRATLAPIPEDQCHSEASTGASTGQQ